MPQQNRIGVDWDIKRTRANCATCQAIAPLQPNLPPEDPIMPDYPFQHIVMDHLALNNESSRVFVDKFTNWQGVYMGDSLMIVCKFVTRLLENYGIPEMLTTDRVSSIGNAHANCRAELAVKSMKRLLRENVNQDGSLNSAKFSRAILQYRNT